jgi:uncharacterized protein involved in exopolysaccharide biosynthesis
MTNENQPSAAEGSGKELRFLDVAAVVLRRWKTVALVTVAAVAVAIPLALLQPKEYTARAVLVPVSEQGSGRAALLAQLPAGLPGLLGGTAQQSNQRLVADILRSRSLADDIAGRLETDSPAMQGEILRVIGRATRVERSVDGSSVTIDVRARDPELAARIANQYAPAVNDIVSRLSAETAQHRARVPHGAAGDGA